MSYFPNPPLAYNSLFALKLLGKSLVHLQFFTDVGIKDDVEKLARDYYLVVARTADLRTLAAEVYGVKELNNSGLKSLTSRVLGKGSWEGDNQAEEDFNE